MSIELVVANLLRLAQGDLDASLVLSAAGNRNAIYHSAQAAEKLIRAILTSENVKIPRADQHRLQELVKLVPDANPVKPTLRDIEYLAAYLTTYRYPTDVGRIKKAPEATEVKEAAEKVQGGIDAAVAHFGVDMGQENSPATNVDPIR